MCIRDRSHSIGVPLAVASDYSFIVPTGTMMIHPVRMSGMIIGASQTYESVSYTHLDVYKRQALMMPHRVCKACGSYNKREIVKVED